MLTCGSTTSMCEGNTVRRFQSSETVAFHHTRKAFADAAHLQPHVHVD